MRHRSDSVNTKKGKSVNILYIEDVEMNARLLALLIENIWGYKIDMAETAEEGLNLIDQKDYDLIFMDINLPKMNGIDAVHAIRKNHDKNSLPVIMVSADMNKDVVASAYQAGANNYITKPINLDILREGTKDYFITE